MSSTSLSPVSKSRERPRIRQTRLDVPVPAENERKLWGGVVGTLALIGVVGSEDNMPAELREVRMPVIGEELRPTPAYLVCRDSVAVQLEDMAVCRNDKNLRYAAHGMEFDPQAVLVVPKSRAVFVQGEEL